VDPIPTSGQLERTQPANVQPLPSESGLLTNVSEAERRNLEMANIDRPVICTRQEVTERQDVTTESTYEEVSAGLLLKQRLSTLC